MLPPWQFDESTVYPERRQLTTAPARDSMRELAMAASPNSAVVVTPSRRRWIILSAACCSAIALVLVVFLGVGRWLVVEDPVSKARAIVILSGGLPVRAIEAAKLYHQGFAPEVWLTHSFEPGESLKGMGIPYEGEEVYSTRVLVHEGVPVAAIHVLEPPIVNTADEVKVISMALEHAKDHSVILVTSKPHTRRARLLWRKLAPGECRAIVRAASTDPFDPRHWWRNSSDALDVVREVLGLLNAWAGLPLTRNR